MLSNQIVVKDEVRELFNAPQVLSQFEPILRAGTNAYLQSAMIVISSSDDLMKCTPQSLVNAALRSASLGLSLDPALRQAYIIPRPLKGVMTACFQAHYSGLHDLAVRTNKYRYISVMPIHQGERVMQNPLTGIHYFTYGGNTIFSPVQGEGGLQVENMRDVTDGKPVTPVIGYLGYFKTLHGFEHSVWMTILEIHQHAQMWAPANYKSQYSAWNDKKKLPYMEMKTVFIALSKFMDLSGSANAKLKAAILDEIDPENEQPIEAETVEPTYVDIPQDQPAAVEELVIESSAPAPRARVALKPNEIITDSDWNNFQRLVGTAREKSIRLPEYVREQMTASRVAGASSYINTQLERVKK